MCVCACVCLWVCVGLRVRVSASFSVWMHLCLCSNVCLFVCVLMCVNICVYAFSVCACGRLCVCGVCTHAYGFPYFCAEVFCICLYICAVSGSVSPSVPLSVYIRFNGQRGKIDQRKDRLTEDV